MNKMWIAGALAVMLGAGTLAVLPAQASTSGRRNTAIGLGAAAIYELANGNTIAGLALGAGAAYGYKRYQDEMRFEDRYGRYGWYHGDRQFRPADHDEYQRRYDRDADDRYDRGSGFRYDRARYAQRHRW